MFSTKKVEGVLWRERTYRLLGAQYEMAQFFWLCVQNLALFSYDIIEQMQAFYYHTLPLKFWDYLQSEWISASMLTIFREGERAIKYEHNIETPQCVPL